VNEARLLEGLGRARPDVAHFGRRWASDLIGLDPRPFASRLNGDGSPLQVCITRSAEREQVHLVVDPGSEERSSLDHHRQGMAILARCASQLVDSSGRATIRRLVRDLLPVDVAAAPGLAAGTVWLGVPLTGHGLAVYLNSAWGREEERWDRLDAWLANEGVGAGARARSIGALRRVARLASVGVDLAAGGPTRLKAYFRLTEPAALSAFGDDLWRTPLLASFLEAVIGDRRFPARGLVFSVAFTAGAEHPVDVKVDVCGHCLGRGPAAAAVARACAAGVPLPRLDAWQIADEVDMAFVGAGCSADGKVRCNVYLKASA
jgi:hypothetical protein